MARLWLHSEPPAGLGLDDFLWREASAGESSLATNLDPELLRFGNVPKANKDAVALAVLAFLADRTSPRPSTWGRDLSLVLPCHEVNIWTAATTRAQAMLEFLTGDAWKLEFVPRRAQPKALQGPDLDADLVCLFSGGADSLCGAARALSDGKKVVLLSHWDWAPHAGVQRELVGALEKLFGIDLAHIQIRLGRRSTQLGDAGNFADEASRRSRSLLFVTLGLAAASVAGAPLWIPENGYASLNPPLAPERRGSLSTRTTHPTFFERLRETLSDAGAYADFRNPFDRSTKGEMFKEIAGDVGQKKAEKLLGLSHSCAHTRWAGMFGLPPHTQCGVCFGCLVRRAAFKSAGLNDESSYVVTELKGAELKRFLAPQRRRDIEAVNYAVAKGINPGDIIGMDLPTDFPVEQALDLSDRGLAELGALEA